jgi:hypothetical protein
MPSMQEGFYRTAATLITDHEVREDPPPTRDSGGDRKGFRPFACASNIFRMPCRVAVV